MKIAVVRQWPKDEYTVGRMFLNGALFCNTLEDRVVDKNKNGRFDGKEKKVAGESAIPYGTYKVTVDKSPKFKRELPRLHDVPHFDGILIHRGNTAKDTAGCILVGLNTAKGKLTQSTEYEQKLVAILKECQAKGEDITITIQ